MSPRRTRATRALGALLLACIGCARPLGPEATLRRFLDLIAEGKTQDAWRMTAPAYREQCDLACFGRVVDRGREELRRALADVRAGVARTELRVAVDLAPGRGEPAQPASLLLVQRGGADGRGRPAGWQIAADPLDFYPQGTPAEALRSFVRAIEGARYGVALRFVPQRLRQQMTAERLRERWEGPGKAELRAQLEAVRRHLAEPLIVEGADARLPVGERREARLVLEDGRWHVLQLQ
jgi:hypothetical protein